MLHVQQLINPAIAADEGLEIKKYTLPRIEPGTSHTESRHSTTELLRNVMPMLIIQLHSKADSYAEQH